MGNTAVKEVSCLPGSSLVSSLWLLITLFSSMLAPTKGNIIKGLTRVITMGTMGNITMAVTMGITMSTNITTAAMKAIFVTN